MVAELCWAVPRIGGVGEVDGLEVSVRDEDAAVNDSGPQVRAQSKRLYSLHDRSHEATTFRLGSRDSQSKWLGSLEDLDTRSSLARDQALKIHARASPSICFILT